jgi:glutamate--cysteine ligase
VDFLQDPWVRQVKEIARPLGIGFLGLGMTPNWSRAEIPIMPKGRYQIMTAYMPKVGKYGLDMMYRTCTVHTNFPLGNLARHRSRSLRHAAMGIRAGHGFRAIC